MSREDAPHFACWGLLAVASAVLVAVAVPNGAYWAISMALTEIGVCAAMIIAGVKRAMAEARGTDPESRAKQLLLRLLTPEQRQEYERTGSFRVRGKTALYHLTPHSRVHAILPNGSEAAICTQFVDYAVPAADLLIAKLLMIRTQENAIWAYPCQWLACGPREDAVTGREIIADGSRQSHGRR